MNTVRCGLLLSLFLLSFPSYSQSALEKSWQILDSGLTDKDTEDRAAAVHLLGMLSNDPKAAVLAQKALKDEKYEVREAAADALGALKAKTAVADLRNVIQKDSEPSVILAAGRALVAMGDNLGYNVFYAVLTGEKKSGDSLMEEQKKMLKDPKKLAAFGFEQGVGFVPFGGVGLMVFKTLTKDDASPVRAAAAKILAADPDAKSLGALEEASGDGSWIVQVAAIAALAQRGDQTAASSIELQLNDSKDAVRYTAAAALIHLNDLKASRPTAAAKRHADVKH